MKDNKGIALIASLLIMAAIMALGAGSMFLAQMNLKITENSRSNAVARYHAEAGVDTAAALLRKIHTDTGKFPATFTLPVTSGQSYAMLAGTEGYRRDNVNQVRVKVEGFTPNNARYVAEALVAPIINPAFLKGLTSEGNIRVSGGGNAEFVNAGIHGNTGLALPGYSNDIFRTCASPTQEFSTCALTNPLPVSSSNGTDCYMTGCDRWASEQKVDPEYTVKRNDAIAIHTFGLTYYLDANDNRVSDGRRGYLYADPAAPSTSININWENNADVYNSRCTVVYSSTNPPPATITTVTDGARICAKDNLSLNFASGINMKDATVIADGNITFGGVSACTGSCSAGTLTNTKLISRTTLNPSAPDSQGGAGQGGVMLDIVTGKDLTIFSGASRDVANSLTGSSPPYYLIGSGFRLTGNTTIAANRDIQFSGQTQLTTYPDKPSAVTTAIISTRRITNNGSGDFYGVFWAGTCFAQGGSAKIFGTVAVKTPGCTTGGNPSAIDISGKLHINSSYAVDNTALYGPVAVVSRR
jgi:hypothetical protein